MEYKLDIDYKLGLHEALNQQSEVWDFDNEKYDPEKLEWDMCNFMLNNKGIGLAANQIDLKKRVFVMGSKDIPNFPKPFALFNPTILEASNETVMDTEGCLSYPGLLIKITRPSWIVGQWQNAQGETKEAKIQGYLAKCSLGRTTFSALFNLVVHIPEQRGSVRESRQKIAGGKKPQP